jgi:hypothetical protein
MKAEKRAGDGKPAHPGSSSSIPNRIFGSLRDALNAASRDAADETMTDERTETESRRPAGEGATVTPLPLQPAMLRPEEPQVAAPQPAPVSAAEAVREAKSPTRESRHYEREEPTTRVVRAAPVPVAPKAEAASSGDAPKTQAVRGRPKVSHTAFHQDPVVGWLVVVGGPGLGAYRPIYEGNNALGRGKSQRIPIDFGDDTISSEEQAYIRYDSSDRSFLFVPNLSKTNIVSVNDRRPTGAVLLRAMDVITMGRTQLAFVPFCGEEFDWSELADLKE